MPALWQTLDEAIQAAIIAQMGAASAYALTSPIVACTIGDEWDPDKWTFPAALIISNTATHETAAAGMPEHVDTRIEYAIIVVDDTATQAEAKPAALEQQRRIVALLRSWPAILAAASAAAGTGEQARRLIWRRTAIQIRGRQGANRGRYLAIAVVYFSIVTNI